MRRRLSHAPFNSYLLFRGKVWVQKQHLYNFQFLFIVSKSDVYRHKIDRGICFQFLFIVSKEITPQQLNNLMRLSILIYCFTRSGHIVDSFNGRILSILIYCFLKQLLNSFHHYWCHLSILIYCFFLGLGLGVILFGLLFQFLFIVSWIHAWLLAYVEPCFQFLFIVSPYCGFQFQGDKAAELSILIYCFNSSESRTLVTRSSGFQFLFIVSVIERW